MHTCGMQRLVASTIFLSSCLSRNVPCTTLCTHTTGLLHGTAVPILRGRTFLMTKIHHHLYQLIRPLDLSKPPLSWLSGFTSLPLRIVYRIKFSQSSGFTLASQIP